VREIIKEQLNFTFQQLEGALSGVSEEEGAARPQGLAPIVWQVGHTAYYDAWLVELAIGGPLLVPAHYAELFQQGSTGDGPLPSLAEVRAAFRRAHEGLLQLADGDLNRPAVSGSEFSTVGGGLIFINVHRGYHIGKVFTLRALLGKPLLS